MQMRDVLGTLFTDDQFTDLYPTNGRATPHRVLPHLR
ncbi:hypothetical protein ANRL4_01523 [Anaerolineae bacterium]|nr:hypothetical protein ANRL4_01523 [Anaerolineae bacterium]